TNTDTQVYNNVFTLAFARGVGDGVRFGLGESLVWDQINQSGQGAAGSQTAATSFGPRNPDLTAAWRFLENSDDGLSGDLSLAIDPSLGPQKAPDANHSLEGNGLTGFWAVVPALDFFWTSGENELRLGGGAEWDSRGRTNGVDAL